MSFESREVTDKFWLNPMTAQGRYSTTSDQETVDDVHGYCWFTELDVGIFVSQSKYEINGSDPAGFQSSCAR